MPPKKRKTAARSTKAKGKGKAKAAKTEPEIETETVPDSTVQPESVPEPNEETAPQEPAAEPSVAEAEETLQPTPATDKETVPEPTPSVAEAEEPRQSTAATDKETIPEPTSSAMEVEETPQPATATEQQPDEAEEKPTTATTTTDDASTSTSTNAAADAATKAQERMARFRALQARAKTSADQNLKEATRESQRQAADPQQLTALGRKHAIAAHKLLRADVEEGGGDFERKRAWDWTAEESERWDRRVRKRAAHRDDTAFRDYAHESQKAYKRQVRGMGPPDLERYVARKLAAVEKAAAAGTLDIVETDDGEVVAVDRDGSFFFSSAAGGGSGGGEAADSGFAQNKPDKAAVDRLVADMRKAEDAALKKRRDRMAANGDDADVMYVNEKNKQFNQKLNRFYNKYTAEIRESFERGTAV